jgi:predicted transcriptional regulator
MEIPILSFLEIINRVTQKIAPGPAPSFNEVHVVKTMELINDSKNIGRKRLSVELGLGEGTTRTLLKHLKNEGIIKSTKTGIMFSNHGRKLFTELSSKISKCIIFPRSSLTIGSCNIAVLIRNSAQAIGNGLEQRDIAIKSGATGATTLIYSNKTLSLPTGEENLLESLPELHIKLINQFKPKENDVIIVGCGKNQHTAEMGAKMAAIKLLRNSN